LEIVKKYHLPNDKTKRKEYLAQFRKEIDSNRLLKSIKKDVRAMAIDFKIP